MSDLSEFEAKYAGVESAVLESPPVNLEELSAFEAQYAQEPEEIDGPEGKTILDMSDEDHMNWFKAPTSAEEREKFYSNLPSGVLKKIDKASSKAVRTYDLEEAREILKEAGASEGKLRREAFRENSRGTPQEIEAAYQAKLRNLAGEDDFAFNLARTKAMVKFVGKKQLNVGKDSEGNWNVHYNKPMKKWSHRMRIAMADTPAEKKAAIEDITGREAKFDLAGRVLYYNEEAKGYATVDSLDLEIEDIGPDWVEWLPPAAAAIATSFIPGVKEASTMGKIGRYGILEPGAAAAGAGAVEAVEWAHGWNQEERTEISARLTKQFLADAAIGTVLGFATPAISQAVNNPFSASLTSENKTVLNYFRNFEAMRAGRDPEEFQSVIRSLEEFDRLPQATKETYLQNPEKMFADFKLRPSQVNAAPFVARVESLLSKLPGAAGVFRGRREEFARAIRQETAWMLRDIDDVYVVAEDVHKMLEKAYVAHMKEMNSLHGLRTVGLEDPEDVGSMLFDAIKRGETIFRDRAQKRGEGLTGLLTGSGLDKPDLNIIPTSYMKGAIKGIKKRSNLSQEEGPFSIKKGLSDEIESFFTERADSISVEDYRFIQNKISGWMRSNPNDSLLQKSLYEISESLRKTATGKGGLTIIQKNMKSLGYDSETRKMFVKEFSEYNNWYKSQKMIWDSKADPQSVFGHILNNFREGGAGMEDIVDMIVPFGVTRRASSNNMAFVRHLKDNLTPEEMKRFQEVVTYRVAGDGVSRTPDDILDILDPQQDAKRVSLISEALGEGKVAAIRAFANGAKRLTETDVFKLAVEQNDARKLMNSIVKGKGLQEYKQAVDFLDGEGNQAGVEKIRQLFLSDLLEGSEKLRPGEMFRTVDGDKLINSMERIGGEHIRDIVGSETYDSLLTLGHLARQQTDASMAGGLAAGIFIMNLFRTGDVVGGAVTGVKLNLLSKALLSDSAVNWFSRDPLEKASVDSIRDMAAGMYYLTATGTRADTDGSVSSTELYKAKLDDQERFLKLRSEIDFEMRKHSAEMSKLDPFDQRVKDQTTAVSEKTRNFINSLKKM